MTKAAKEGFGKSSQQMLPRTIGWAALLFLTLSATTPASSLFVIMPGAIAAAGEGGVTWAFLLAGLVCLGTAYLYAELSSAFPVAGGEYVMVARTLGPLPGFVVLGVNVFNNVLFPPVIGLGTAAVLEGLAPGLPRIPVAIAVVAAATACALLSIRANAWVTGAFLLLEMAALGILAWLGFAAPARGLVAISTMPATHGAAGIGIATTIILFALNGYGMAVYFGEETQGAAARIGRVILVSFALALAAEAVPLLAFLIGSPELAAAGAADDPFGLFVEARAGGLAAHAMAIAVVVAIVNAAIVTVLASARFLYATARDGVWGGPADVALGRVSTRGVPWVATLAVGALGIACCFVRLPLLLVLNGAGLVVTYAALALAAMAGRRTGATRAAAYRMPLYPAAPVIVLGALGYVAWVSWGDAAEGRPGILATLAQMAGAAGYYLLVVRRRGRWVVHDPERGSAVAMPLHHSATPDGPQRRGESSPGRS